MLLHCVTQTKTFCEYNQESFETQYPVHATKTYKETPNSGETVHTLHVNLVDTAFIKVFDTIKIEKLCITVHKVYSCSVTVPVVHQHKTESYAAAATDCCVTVD